MKLNVVDLMATAGTVREEKEKLIEARAKFSVRAEATMAKVKNLVDKLYRDADRLAGVANAAYENSGESKSVLKIANKTVDAHDVIGELQQVVAQSTKKLAKLTK